MGRALDRGRRLGLELTNADQLAAARALPSGQYLDLAKVDGAPLSFVAADIAAAKAIREELRRLDEEAAILATEDAFAEDEARAAATARLATYYTDLVPLLRAVEAGGIEEARAFLSASRTRTPWCRLPMPPPPRSRSTTLPRVRTRSCLSARPRLIHWPTD